MTIKGKSGKALNAPSPLASMLDVMAMATSTPSTGRVQRRFIVDLGVFTARETLRYSFGAADYFW
jgi:hypothetical protein